MPVRKNVYHMIRFEFDPFSTNQIHRDPCQQNGPKQN